MRSLDGESSAHFSLTDPVTRLGIIATLQPMTDPNRSADDAWKNAEAFIQRMEQLGRMQPGRDYLDQVTREFLIESRASATAIWLLEGDHYELLSRNGVDLFSFDQVESVAEVCQQSSGVSAAQWIVPPVGEAGQTRLVAAERLYDDAVLGLTIRFDRAVELSRREPLKEMTEVMLDLVASVYVRIENRSLRAQLDRRLEREDWIGRLHDGVDVTEAFAAISVAVAKETGCDRVSLLRPRGSRMELVASSTQPRVDRRARQVRLLQQLAAATVAGGGRLKYVVGSPVDVADDLNEPLEQYLDESGCREITIDSFDNEAGQAIAVMTLERFRLDPGFDPSEDAALTSLRGPVRQAIGRALARDDAGWSFVASRLSRGSAARKMVATGVFAMTALILLWIVPAPLMIPVEGRVEAARSVGLFAPTAGTVVEVKTDNGDTVAPGQSLLVIRSPQLELQQKELEGKLDTATTQLASLGALRSRGSSSTPGTGGGGVADEQVLKTQIAGYQSQLALLRQEIANLTLTSPIQGTVDGWNLKQSLAARPVTHGQHLADVISTEGGWMIELDLPDKHAAYVLEQQQRGLCRCTFTLTSGSGQTYHGTAEEIAEVAQINSRGQSVIRVVVPYPEAAQEFRVGATVLAELDCGKRSLGFVWFRGLVEWTRRQSWL